MKKFVFCCDCKNYELLASELYIFGLSDDQIDYLVDHLHSHDQVTRYGLRLKMIGRHGGSFETIKLFF